MNNIAKGLSTLGKALSSKAAVSASTLGLFALLQMNPTELSAQQVVTQKGYNNVLSKAIVAQEPIGESMAAYLYGGGLQKTIQAEIERQNTLHPDTNSGKFSLFLDEDIESNNHPDDAINTKASIKAVIHDHIDSLAQKDFATYYKSFHDYHTDPATVLGHKKGKGELGSGYHVAPFSTSISVDYLAPHSFLQKATKPYTKDDIQALKSTFDKLYNKYLSAWKTDALTKRQSLSSAEYASADLLSLEAERQKFVKEVCTIADKIVDTIFREYYSKNKDRK